MGRLRSVAMFARVLLALPTLALAQAIPADAPNCALQDPPEAAAQGLRPPHRVPTRMYPVNPGPEYTGCQWIWTAYAYVGLWDYRAVTYYERGVPKAQRVRFPPLPVQATTQECTYTADGRATKRLEGYDWQQECPSVPRLRELLRAVPKDGEAWDFL